MPELRAVRAEKRAQQIVDLKLANAKSRHQAKSRGDDGGEYGRLECYEPDALEAEDQPVRRCMRR